MKLNEAKLRGFTKAEKATAHMLVEGLGTLEMATKCEVSYNAIRNRITRIARKLKLPAAKGKQLRTVMILQLMELAGSRGGNDIMLDITKCKDVGCVRKDICLRYTSKPHEFRQSWFMTSPRNKSGKCDAYMPDEKAIATKKLEEQDNASVCSE